MLSSEQLLKRTFEVASQSRERTSNLTWKMTLSINSLKEKKLNQRTFSTVPSLLRIHLLMNESQWLRTTICQHSRFKRLEELLTTTGRVMNMRETLNKNNYTCTNFNKTDKTPQSISPYAQDMSSDTARVVRKFRNERNFSTALK